MTTTAEASRKIRAALKAAFPSTKFAVSLSSGRGIAWTDDGPSVKKVEDALLAAGCGEAEIAWNGTRYIEIAGERFVSIGSMPPSAPPIGRIWSAAGRNIR